MNNETEPTSKVLQALNELAKCHPSESHRDQVASLLVPYLKNTKRTSNTKAAIRALAVWGNASHAPELERLLPLAKFRSTQEIIFSALGEIGDETTAARMLPFLKRADYGYLATQAFHRLDSNVEDELISLLSSSDLYLRA